MEDDKQQTGQEEEEQATKDERDIADLDVSEVDTKGVKGGAAHACQTRPYA